MTAVRRRDLGWSALHGIALAVVGVLGEGLFSIVGLFVDRLQRVIDQPWWLAGLHLHGSIALLEAARGATALRPSRHEERMPP